MVETGTKPIDEVKAWREQAQAWEDRYVTLTTVREYDQLELLLAENKKLKALLDKQIY